ncbi:bifunctional indole-3-glycerol-phosphate synthase TrpC/phosphoribosylanthranilate isomerase TrpF [Candidatus Pantoea edessiphila]|uniref:Multifunctional fusion protein n=1 Tax=Candidatus Pantoea edessiphila TaxID=2044610 RepID=A0A2P5SYP5_9GAMM|nr:bifunctional indole-3-glycerol-phosphate synthase TrpC/phosphoribosylanthranilate isomerase TrpF [Candidatus Pantoea edessiphila]MBK4775416.1 bifunctional indole-3-glycerol-phosphate synthase TrpC/phosphoribosylanthranilate isomerase TrpF [Pantoea sp. Edef]PPI87454.1 bifunctional indole-3-glycerol-phosphate synthase TrpC/phosphoribosylanthranilate isomerase TrpF [Candidatus Pantoea edessiphila]
MQGTVLNKIIQDKIVWIETRKKKQPISSFQKKIKSSIRNFYDALKGTNTKFILECKKASPSKGLIRKGFNPLKIARIYRHYASVVSVLTDEKYFQGDFSFLSVVSSVIKQPVLCKDFIIDPYQIYLARNYYADAVLLMLSILDDEKYCQFAAIANELNMGILTEVSNQKEIERAIALKAKVIGINNRSFQDLSVDLERTRELVASISNSEIIVISESGIDSYSNIRKFSHLVNGFLIGSKLMEEDNLELAVRRMLLGNNKICGLSRSEDAYAAYNAGAIFGGLIFVDGSPRKINSIQAKRIITHTPPLQYVGVYKNAKINEIVEDTNKLGLAAIQLNGDENQDFIVKLRHYLPSDTQIWKALSISDKIPKRDLSGVDLYLFDNEHGGSGKKFNWNLLKDQELNNVMLAGGLNISNCMVASKIGCSGLDFNSGVESAPGIKDVNKIQSIFKILRDY